MTAQEVEGPNPSEGTRFGGCLRGEDQQQALLLDHIDGIVIGVFGFGTTQQIDRQNSLSDNGLDSLMALEIKNRLEYSFKVTLQSALLFDRPNTDSLGEFRGQEFGLSQDDAVSSAIEDKELLEDLESFTDEELSPLLENELDD